jgi:hypothetical protein
MPPIGTTTVPRPRYGDRSTGTRPCVIATASPGYLLRVEPGDTDLAAFEAGLGAARAAAARGDAATAAACDAAGTYVFRSRGDAGRLHDVVKFNWEMVAKDGGEVAGVGLEIPILGPDGRILSDYQFLEGRRGDGGTPPPRCAATTRAAATASMACRCARTDHAHPGEGKSWWRLLVG